MKTYSRVYFSLSIFGNFSEVANLAKIKPTQKIPDIVCDLCNFLATILIGDKSIK